jgi:hypothetical protein
MKAIVATSAVVLITAVSQGQGAVLDYKRDMPRDLQSLSKSWPMRSIELGPTKYTERMHRTVRGESYNLSLVPWEVRSVVPEGEITRIGRLVYDGPMFFEVVARKQVVALIRVPGGWSSNGCKVWIRPLIGKTRMPEHSNTHRFPASSSSPLAPDHPRTRGTSSSAACLHP